MSEMCSTREAYGRSLSEIGNNKNIIVLDADLSCCTMSQYFQEKYPERFFNMGIAESNMMCVAAGIALGGKKVFANTFAMFSAGRAFEQIRNSIAYPNLNVTIVGTHAGLTVGKDGATHQCLEDISLMRAVPNIKVLTPSDAVETRRAVEWIFNHDGPVYLRLNRLPVEIIYDNIPITIGKATTLMEGNDITLIGCGFMVHKVVEAAQILKQHDITARVLGINSIKPMDDESIIKAAKDTQCIVTAEEHNIIGGLGSAVSEILSENYPVPIKRVGVQDCFGRSGNEYDLMECYGLTTKNIVEEALKLYKNKMKNK